MHALLCIRKNSFFPSLSSLPAHMKLNAFCNKDYVRLFFFFFNILCIHGIWIFEIAWNNHNVRCLWMQWFYVIYRIMLLIYVQYVKLYVRNQIENGSNDKSAQNFLLMRSAKIRWRASGRTQEFIFNQLPLLFVWLSWKHKLLVTAQPSINFTNMENIHVGFPNKSDMLFDRFEFIMNRCEPFQKYTYRCIRKTYGPCRFTIKSNFMWDCWLGDAMKFKSHARFLFLLIQI